MSDLDDELKKALDESEATATSREVDAPDNEVDGDERRTGRSLGLLAGLLVIGGAILAFVLGQETDDLVYSKQVQEVVGSFDELGERNLRVQGILKHGSMKKREEPCEYRFDIRPKDDPTGATLQVRYASCIIPDTLRDVKDMDVEVTAEGKLQDGGNYLEAKHVFAKCPSKYEMQQRKAAGETAPHGEKPELNPMDVIPGAGQGS